MTFEEIDRELGELCFNVKMRMAGLSGYRSLEMGMKGVPEGRAGELARELEMAIGYLTDVRIQLYQMCGYDKGYEKGLSAAKEA